MKSLFILIFIVTLSATPSAFAAHGGKHTHDHSEDSAEPAVEKGDVKKLDCDNAVQVKVNGLVCDFCARALEKVFSKREEVDHIRVNLAEGKVTVAMKPGSTMDDATVKELITNSGYDVSGMSKGCL